MNPGLILCKGGGEGGGFKKGVGGGAWGLLTGLKNVEKQGT